MRVVTLITLTLSLLFITSPADTQGSDLAESVAAYLTEQVERHGLAGLAVAVVDQDGVIYQGGYGSLTADSQLPIASLSKAFTALAVMQQVEAGHIDLDAAVQTYLPGFRLADTESAAEITVRHLLNQTSGLGDAGYPPPDFAPETTLESAVRDLVNARMLAPAGTEYHYFNPNYQLLGLLVEQVTGQTLPDYFQTQIFAPLGMTATRTMPPGTPHDLPQGHLTVFGWPLPAPETVYGEYIIPSGGIVSTADDMAHFLRMQLNAGQSEGQQIVTPASIDQMHTPPAIASAYAMGWKTGRILDVPVLEHGGDLDTYHAQMMLLPDEKRAFVYIVNQNGFLHNFTSYMAINDGLVALLSQQTPPAVLSMRLLGGLLLAVVVITALAHLWGVRRLWRRRAHWRGRSWWRVALSSVVDLLPLGLLLALPYLVWPLLGRVATYQQLLYAIPDLLLLVLIAAISGMLRVVIRLGAARRLPD